MENRPHAVIPLRGGGWLHGEEYVNPDYEGHYYKDWSAYDVGIRLVRTNSTN
jgi:hypothetical protein